MAVQILQGDCRDLLKLQPDNHFHCCVTSPPYHGLRDYGDINQIGLEATSSEFVEALLGVFAEVRRVLRPDGTLWLNLGDSSLNKQLQGVPWRVALALQNAGWWLRSDIIWAKPNPMPESVKSRPTRSHEYLFLLSKSADYYYDHHAIKEPHTSMDNPPGNKSKLIKGRLGGGGGWDERPSAERSFPAGGRNKRDVWTIHTKPYSEAHFATFPPALVAPCIQAGCSEWGCCATCGAPWTRILEKGEPLEEQRAACGADSSGGYRGTATKDYSAGGAQDPSATKARILAGMVERRTVGWDPSCQCGAAVVPCRALDPFGGSGTVGEVATKYGCDAVLMELNPEYAKLARDRNRQGGLFS